MCLFLVFLIIFRLFLTGFVPEMKYFVPASYLRAPNVVPEKWQFVPASYLKATCDVPEKWHFVPEPYLKATCVEPEKWQFVPIPAFENRKSAFENTFVIRNSCSFVNLVQDLGYCLFSYF